MEKTKLEDMRRQYGKHGLLESDAGIDPLALFARWFDQAIQAKIVDPNAMTLATASKAGEPSCRVVLLKSFDEKGFVFFTNYESEKGKQLKENPKACVNFFWAELERQVRISGRILKVSRQESELYFNSGPVESQLGAWASAQSTVVSSREELEKNFAEAQKKFGGSKIPLPEFWGGYLLSPDEMEFWQGRPSRLHDRIVFKKEAGTWKRSRLSP